MTLEAFQEYCAQPDFEASLVLTMVPGLMVKEMEDILTALMPDFRTDPEKIAARKQLYRVLMNMLRYADEGGRDTERNRNFYR